MFNAWKKFLLVAALAVAAVGSAQAAMVDIGDISSVAQSTLVSHSSGSTFTDYVRFTLGGGPGYQVGAVAANLQLSTIFNIINLAFVEIWKDNGVAFTGGGDTLVCSGAGCGFSGLSWQGLLAAGSSYYFVINGQATGTGGGSYLFAATASPVPLPAAVWLLAAGLAGLVGIARRKRPDSASAIN